MHFLKRLVPSAPHTLTRPGPCLVGLSVGPVRPPTFTDSEMWARRGKDTPEPHTGSCGLMSQREHLRLSRRRRYTTHHIKLHCS
jgi:hypothetical protein